MTTAATIVRGFRRFLIGAGILLLVALLVRLWTGGYLDRDPVWRFPPTAPRAPVEVLFLSGDAGMRHGMGPFVAQDLAAHGIGVTALSTSTLFRFGRSRAELDAIVAHAVAGAERRADGRRLVLIGQSYGADILQTGLAHLPAALRPGIAGVILIVPGTGTYFRADPTGLLYHLTPDSRSVTTVPAITWAPLTCIHGKTEADSVCPLLSMPNLSVVELPGSHYLDHDKPRLAATVLHAIGRIVTPDARRVAAGGGTR